MDFFWIPEDCLIAFLSSNINPYLKQFFFSFRTAEPNANFVSAFHLSGRQPPWLPLLLFASQDSQPLGNRLRPSWARWSMWLVCCHGNDGMRLLKLNPRRHWGTCFKLYHLLWGWGGTLGGHFGSPEQRSVMNCVLLPTACANLPAT